ncbi:MAG: penicillin-binding protein activator [Pseudomonadota bacterium]
MHCGTCHRWFFAGLLTIVLYGGAPAIASEAAIPAVSSPYTGAAIEQPARAALPEDAAAAAPSDPHIALLLPVNSNAFAQHAEAVKSGFLTAARTHGRTLLPIRVYAVNDDQDIVAGYRQALAAGARLVVGPLTRNGVTTLATSGLIAVPTLALNVPEGGLRLPANLYTLSLQVEAEALQAAQLAYKEGRLNAFTVYADTPILRRIHQAFIDEFTRLGGKHVAEYAYTPDPAGLGRIKQAIALGVADMVFLALDFPRARVARPYLDPLALYATSQVHPGNAGALAGFDLAEVRFFDMPWLLQPDHPAVMVYPRQDYRDAPDLDRLYALGIDAFRIAQDLLDGNFDPKLDGVTGRITLGRDQHFVRELVSARFSEGRLLAPADNTP